MISEGKFLVPPATASLMYAPEIYGRSEVQTVSTTKESQLIPGKAVGKSLTNYIKDKRVVAAGVSLLIIVIGIIASIIILRKKGINYSSLWGKVKRLFKKEDPPSSPPPPDPEITPSGPQPTVYKAPENPTNQ